MEYSVPLANLKTQLCVMAVGYGGELERDVVWPKAAEAFLKRVHKLGVHITVIGPRPPFKLGSKKTVRFLDRHEVIGMKLLAKSREYKVELRILSQRLKGWTRLRAEACLVFGPYGALPIGFEGWEQPGILTLDAFSRWVRDYKTLPGSHLVFLGSTNQVLRHAAAALDHGAQSCQVVEPGAQLRCWRAHADRFVSKGGKLLPAHEMLRAQPHQGNMLSLSLKNDQGTRIITADVVVLCPSNDDALNAPDQWKNGLFYLHRRVLAGESTIDEERWLEEDDWLETYWRIAKFLGKVTHAAAEGALKKLRVERRRAFDYRKNADADRILYSGKILERETQARVQSSVSVPRNFARAKPVASLECLQQVPCRACADICPESAIEISDLVDLPKLMEDKCTGCGACVAVCPAGAAVMIRELPEQQKALYHFADDSRELWRSGTQVQMLNRRGDFLGMGRVRNFVSHEAGAHRVIEIESTNIHLWDARGYRAPKKDALADENVRERDAGISRAWVMINGAKRLCPVGVPVSIALWMLGLRRFEDAMLCRDGSCGRCDVVVDGKTVRACQTVVREGNQIEFTRKTETTTPGHVRCTCQQVSAEAHAELLGEGASENLARELTGMGSGTCHGRWCLSSAGNAGGESRQRPVFFGFEGSPWRDVSAADIMGGPVDDELDQETVDEDFDDS